LRHIGIYAYRADFLRAVSLPGAGAAEVTEALEQLRALWHGYRIAVHVTARRLAPEWTRLKTWSACAPVSR
jgi:3-deoxy-manno-octulosonate cytidylyltransferase (CMP-KDO synthetase)